MIERLLKYTEIQFAEILVDDTQISDDSAKSLNDVVNEITQAYELSINHKNIRMHINVEAIILQKNIKQLRTVLDNLISNAIKFTPDQGEIYLSAKREKSTIIIEIKDTGPGINLSSQAQIFDPFYRGDQVSNILVAGSGLGLFIAKETTSLLKGDISIVPKQTNTDFGAHFILQIPFSSLSFNR